MSIKKFSVFFILMFFFSVSLFSQEFFHAEVYGGKPQLKAFIKEELVYPEKARKDKTEGTVELSFLVKSNGKVDSLKVSRSVSPELDKEALRIFRQLLWTPATFRGKKVDDHQTLEIPFRLNKYKRCVKQRGYDDIEYPFTPVDTSLSLYNSVQLDEKPSPVFQKKGMNFTRFISENLVYPPEALKQNVQGTVELFFVIEPSGRVSNVKVLNAVGAGCTQESIRLIKMLRWMPGIKDGMAVRTELTLKISFNLENFKEHRYVSPNNANQI